MNEPLVADARPSSAVRPGGLEDRGVAGGSRGSQSRCARRQSWIESRVSRAPNLGCAGGGRTARLPWRSGHDLGERPRSSGGAGGGRRGQPPAGPAVAALEVERGQERLTNGRARRGAAGQSARSPSGPVDRRHPESGSTRSGVGRDDLCGPPRLVEGRINEGSGFHRRPRRAPPPRHRSRRAATARPGADSRAPPAGCSTQGDPAFEQGRSRPGCVRHAAPFRSTCGTSLREARLERETRNSRRRTARQPRRGGHGRAGRAHAAAWMTSREPVFTPIAPSRIAGRRGPPPRRRPS